jgi:hypothetical protein
MSMKTGTDAKDMTIAVIAADKAGGASEEDAGRALEALAEDANGFSTADNCGW